ncbi:hypothetical protein COV16_01540 [Candidatus Woesearchaeota archaeon CG10_big_fil_rev_8_21_14_0_10_34_8]|nr:MAG: hypothetical protein COV16_01540 [Candidatus Woesearchaeota archaeon CG10_big_fil_rev_8_21_14_0_10_34_8]
MKDINHTTGIAVAALIAMAFLFVMTATQGEYWGANDISDYIVTVTEGEDESYLDSSTPTAMVSVNQEAFIDREGSIQTVEVCEDAGYVIADGQKIQKVASCKTMYIVLDNNEEPSTKHDVGYSN